MKKINLNTLAIIVTQREGGKKSLSIAQVKEVMRITLEELGEYKVSQIMELLGRY